MKQFLDIETWARKDHFTFFKQFDEPFWGVTVTLDCTQAYQLCKEKKYSFFLYYLHKSILAANRIEAFRYRIEDEKVVIYDEIHPSATIGRNDETFGFSYMNYHENFLDFANDAQLEIERVKNTTGLFPILSGNDVIHYSSIPWLNFTSISHARSFVYKDSCPKISFGKLMDENGKKTMSLSIHVHHALMDGFHVGKFVDYFQGLMNE